jgi:DUF4097 and DUF4098 domain-containing protein YvlB
MAMANTRQLGAFLVMTGAALAVWSFGDRDTTDEHEVSSKISVVELDASHADISIQVGDVDVTTIKEKRSYWLVKHGETYSVDGDTLRLDGDCGWQCRADLVVTVPPGTRVTGDNGAGDLSLTGVGGVDARLRSGDATLRDVRGDVKLDLTSGDVSIENLAGKLDIEASSGDISAAHLTGGPVHVKTTSGDLQVQLDEANDVTAQGTSSDIRVVVPAGSYRTTTDTTSGDVSNQLVADPNGTHQIDARTVSGDVALASK